MAAVLDRLEPWSNTGKRWMFNEANGGRSKRSGLADSRGFDTLKAAARRPEGRGRSLWPDWFSRETTKGCDPPPPSQREKRERERSWQSKQGRTRVHDGVDRLHYVRDRAKLLGIWIIETKLSHLCLQSSRYFKRSCSLDRVADVQIRGKEAYFSFFLFSIYHAYFLSLSLSLLLIHVPSRKICIQLHIFISRRDFYQVFKRRVDVFVL